jgi:hypothetical protein
MILAIQHRLGELPIYSLGYYNKNLFYRIAEIIASGKKVSSEIRGTQFVESVDIYDSLTSLKIKELEIQINEVGLGSTQTLGFSTTLGFNTTLGFIGNVGEGTVLYREDLA